MKPMFLLATLSWMFGVPQLVAKTEVETLRSRCAEQERQIRQLEDENAKLRSLNALANERNGDKAGRPAAASPAPAASATDAKVSATYTVRANDTLERVSRKLGITPAALAGMNGLKATSTIHEGQKLKIPGTASADAAAPKAAAAPTDKAATPQKDASGFAGKTHEMKQNETFFSVGKKYGIPTATLIEANPGINPNTLRPGQVIQLSKPAATASAPDKSAAPDKPAAPPEADKKAPAQATPPVTKPQPAAPVTPASPAAAKKTSPPTSPDATPTAKSNIRSVVIEAKTTYGEFAAKHGTTISRLNDLNALDLVESTELAKGSELYVPTKP